MWEPGDGKVRKRPEEEVEAEKQGLKREKWRGEEGKKIQYIFNLADVIRLCVCQERRIS